MKYEERRTGDPIICRHVFSSSLSVLSFEVLLLRIFSIKYSYHYGSLVLSVAMLGYVSGSLLFWRRHKALKGVSADSYMLFLAASLLFLYLSFSFLPFDLTRLLFERTQVFYMVLFVLLCSVPFFLYSLLFSSFLFSKPDMVGMIYGSDLIGAACGVLLPTVLLPFLRIEGCFLLIGLFLSLQVFFSCHCSKRLISLLVSSVFLLVVLKIPVEPSVYKGLMQFLREEGSRLLEVKDSLDSRVYIFESPRMRYAPGLSLTYPQSVPSGKGVSVDGNVRGVLLEPSKSFCAFYPFLPTYIPYFLLEGKARRTLVVGPRSTYEILCPYHLFGSEITLAERDRCLRKILERELRGGPFPAPKISRSFRPVIRSGNRFDVISLPVLSFSPSHPFGLAEDTDLTLEGLELLMEGLSEGGMLFIEVFFLPPPRIELRLFLTILDALRRKGIRDVERRLVVIRTFDTVVFLVKNGELTKEERLKTEHLLRKMQWEMLFPHRPRTVFHSPYDLSLLLSQAYKGRELLLRSYPYEVSPCSDDRPFFNYFLKVRTIPEIYRLSSRRWVYFLFEGMTLPFLLLFLVLFSLALFLPCVSIRLRPRGTYSLYFFSIGFSFMAFEVYFIHQWALLMDSPSYGFALGLLFMLLASGIGSLLSRHVRTLGLLAMAAFCLLLISLYVLSPSPRHALIALPLLPIVGLFFPYGTKVLMEKREDLPFYYAANGCASILSPPICLTVSLSFGFRTLLLFSSILYLLALSLLYLACHRYKQHRT